MQAETQLYSRGKYRLERDVRRDGTPRSPNFQIVWYDEKAGRNRYRSTRSSSLPVAEDALDRLYSQREKGVAICPCCQRPLEKPPVYSVDEAVIDYLAAKSPTCSSITEVKARLKHFLNFVDAKKHGEIDCSEVTEELIGEFRIWSSDEPVFIGKPENGITRKRSPSTTEASVRQLKAVINFAFRKKHILTPAEFSPLPPDAVDVSPTFRASLGQLTDMFRYCTDPQPSKAWKQNHDREWTAKEYEFAKQARTPLLRFLQFSIATWCRPDAAHSFSTAPERQQWIADAQAVRLNQKGRIQTKKRRPTLPIARQLVPLLESTDGYFVPVESVRTAFESMIDDIGIRQERETGMKLIRRSISQLVRDKIGEHRWIQGRIMLGHEKPTTSDIYALRKPAHLGLALRHTEAIIDEIERAVPGAFTGVTPERETGKDS